MVSHEGRGGCERFISVHGKETSAQRALTISVHLESGSPYSLIALDG